MTDDDLTRLRDEVAGVLERMTADVSDADHVRYRSGYDEGCGTCVRVRREVYEVADALLPLLARKIAEARGEAWEDVDDRALQQAEERGYEIGKAEVRARVEAVWPDPFGEFTATEAAAAKLMKDEIRAALAEPTGPECER